MAHAPQWKNVLVKLLKSLGLAFAAVVVVVAIMGFSFWKVQYWAPPVNGKHLEEVFNVKRASFEQLVHMTAEDANGTVAVGNGLLY